MIRSFRGRLAALILQQRRVPKGFPTEIAKVARRKLVQLNNATTLGDLAAPPGNRLEALRGDLADKHSIRINDQWRVVFRRGREGPEEVEIVDYHCKEKPWPRSSPQFIPARSCARNFSAR